MAMLLESASLFEVNVPDYKQLKQCRKEIVLLKTLWDYVFIVRSSIGDWKTTIWKDINVEQMEMDCKKFSKDVRYLRTFQKRTQLFKKFLFWYKIGKICRISKATEEILKIGLLKILAHYEYLDT